MASEYSAGRKRSTARQHSIEDQALNQIAQEAESRLTARRAARAEAREIRTRELERQQKEEEEKEREGKTVDLKKDSVPKFLREESDDSDDDDERDLKKELYDLKTRYRKAMVTNAQLDNDKILLRYEVDLLTESLTETEELSTELQRELKERTKELEKKKTEYDDLETKSNHISEQLTLRDSLIEQHGLVFIQDEGEGGKETVDGAAGGDNGVPSTALISAESVKVLESFSGSLDERLKRFADEKKMFEKQIKKLKQELQDEKEKQDQRSSRERFTPSRASASRYPTLSNGGATDPDLTPQADNHSELLKELSETRIRQKRAETEVATLQGTIVRLESQMKRYKKEAENGERVEEEFKIERRKWQKELREMKTQKEDLEMQVESVQKRLDKAKRK